MIDFSTLVGALVRLRKPPHQEVFEAQVIKVSANDQFVNLKLPDGSTVWEEAELLQFPEP